MTFKIYSYIFIIIIFTTNSIYSSEIDILIKLNDKKDKTFIEVMTLSILIKKFGYPYKSKRLLYNYLKNNKDSINKVYKFLKKNGYYQNFLKTIKAIIDNRYYQYVDINLWKIFNFKENKKNKESKDNITKNKILNINNKRNGDSENLIKYNLILGEYLDNLEFKNSLNILKKIELLGKLTQYQKSLYGYLLYKTGQKDKALNFFKSIKGDKYSCFFIKKIGFDKIIKGLNCKKLFSEYWEIKD